MRALIKSRRRRFELNQVELTIAGQIEELLAAVSDSGKGRSLDDPFDGPKPSG